MKNFRPFSSATKLLFCAICLALLSPSPASAQSADDYLKQAKKAELWSKEQFDLYMKAAELGNAEAQCAVGFRYAANRGVAEDDYEAFKWYKKSADQGYAEGIFYVGEAYYWGEGVQRDYKMAEKYFLSAAYKGFYPAYFFFFFLYQYHLENKNEAIYWFKKDVDYTYAERGEPDPTTLEKLRELGVYYHPNDKSSNSSQTQSQAQTQTQTETQQVYTPEYGVRDVWVNCFDCHGTGQCSYCKGTGWCISTNGRGEYNSTYKCTICHGSGRCTYCYGTGGHYEKQQYQIR